MIWILFGILCVACGICYRKGGTNAGTLWRDIGASICLILVLPLVGMIHTLWQGLSLIAVFGLLWASLSTYRYFLPKPESYTCWYYMIHGSMVSLADLPLIFFTGKWISFGIRCIVNAGLVGLWSGLMKWDVGEEFGRGFILCSTRLFYLLPF
jgi:hypothetical protein